MNLWDDPRVARGMQAQLDLRRKRLDGGYTVADGNANVAPIVPDSFRFLGDFMPALRTEYSSLRLRLDGRFLQEWREARRHGAFRPDAKHGATTTFSQNL